MNDGYIPVRGGVANGWTDKTDRLEFKIYDKRLEVLKDDKYLWRDEDGRQIYLSYVNAPFEITRFEYKAKARTLRERRASVNSMLATGAQDCADACKRYWLVDLMEIAGAERVETLQNDTE